MNPQAAADAICTRQWKHFGRNRRSSETATDILTALQNATMSRLLPDELSSGTLIVGGLH